jgi:hypothetical protein
MRRDFAGATQSFEKQALSAAMQTLKQVQQDKNHRGIKVDRSFLLSGDADRTLAEKLLHCVCRFLPF